MQTYIFEETFEMNNNMVWENELRKCPHEDLFPNPAQSKYHQPPHRTCMCSFSNAGPSNDVCYPLRYPCPKQKPDVYDLSIETRDHWEIAPEHIDLKNKIGQGQFGEVWKGNSFAFHILLIQLCCSHREVST